MDMQRIIDLSAEEKIFYYETDDDNDTTYHIASNRTTAAYTLCGKDIEAEELETEGDQRKPYGDICLICSQDFERSRAKHEAAQAAANEAQAAMNDDIAHALAETFIVRAGGIKEALQLLSSGDSSRLMPHYSEEQQGRIIAQVRQIAKQGDAGKRVSAARDHVLQSLADLDRMIDTNRTAAEIHAQIAAITERVKQL